MIRRFVHVLMLGLLAIWGGIPELPKKTLGIQSKPHPGPARMGGRFIAGVAGARYVGGLPVPAGGAPTADEIAKNLADVSTFVREKYDPMNERLNLLGEENERLVAEVQSILEEQKRAKRAGLFRQRGTAGHPVVESGKYRGFTPLDMSIMGSVLRSLEKQPDDVDPRLIEQWREGFGAARRALDEATSGAGAELTSQETAAELWMDVNLQTAVAALFNTITMPSKTFEIPLQLGDINWYPGTANLSTVSTTPGTDERQMTAHELVGMVPWSYNLDEDAVIAVMNEVRATLVRNTAEVLDDIILNADTTALNNINADGATITPTTPGYAQHLIGFDGLRHIGLVDNTTQGNDHNAVTDEAMYNELRGLMGKYGVRPSDIAFICDIQTYLETVGLTSSNVRTLDKYGPQATILTGELAAIEGVPLIVAEQLRETDDDGKVTYPIADSGNDNGTLICVNRTQYRKGFRRELSIETNRNIEKRQTLMVASLRVAFEGRNANASDTAMAMQYNIT